MTATRLGFLFVLLGFSIVGAALDIMVTKGLTALAVSVLTSGILVSVLGALIVPSSGAAAAVDKLSPYIPFGRRANSGEVTVTPTEKSDAP